MDTNITLADVNKLIVWLSYKDVRPHDMTWFSANFIYFMLALVVASKLLESVIFPTFLRNFREYNQRDVRNMVTYILEVVVTSYCFYINVTSGMQVVQQTHTQRDVELHRMALVILSCLYTYELMYRMDMNAQLFLHHIITIAFIILGLEGAYVTRDSKFVAGSVHLCMTATTEQFSFIALFLYRIRHKYAGFALRTSAMQTIVFKTFLIYAAITNTTDTVFHPVRLHNPNGPEWYLYWRALIIGGVPLLYITQVYGAYVMWKIGASRRLMGKEMSKDDVYETKPIKKE